MAEFPGGQGLELDVVLDIGRRYNHCTRPSVLEEYAFKGCQAGEVEMLNYLYYGCGIITF